MYTWVYNIGDQVNTRFERPSDAYKSRQ
jgi:hypothetical protein